MSEEHLPTPSTEAWLWEKTKRIAFAVMLLVCLVGMSASAASLWHLHVAPIDGLESYKVSHTWMLFIALLLFTTEGWVAGRNLHGGE
jgi:hypothetical protein